MNLPLCRLWLLNHRKGLLLKVTAKFGMTSAVFSFDWYKATCLKDQYPVPSMACAPMVGEEEGIANKLPAQPLEWGSALW